MANQANPAEKTPPVIHNERVVARDRVHRRLRGAHGLIERVPRTRRYSVTGTGLQHALLFTHAHDHLLRAGLAQVSDPSPPRKTKLHNAARAYEAAVDELTQQAQLAA